MNSPTGRKGSAPGLEPDINGAIKLKCVLVGDASVGKTSLAFRFSHNKFQKSYRQKIGEFTNTLSMAWLEKNTLVLFNISNSIHQGQERYKSLVPMYLRGAHIALVVYDVTDPNSFANIGVWLDALHHHGDLIKTILVGNKSDLTPAFDEEMVLEYAQNRGLPAAKTSAKTGENVEQLFLTMGSKVIRHMKRELNAETFRDKDKDKVVIEAHKGREKKRKKCCKT